MVGLGRVELPTRSLGNCCSIHLSYSPTQPILPKKNAGTDLAPASVHPLDLISLYATATAGFGTVLIVFKMRETIW